jgi:hypothetical protein
MSLTIIIAHYNAFEYNDFIQLVENNLKLNLSCIVYNKSPKLIECNPLNAKVISLPNVGREGETYLNHIICNYENLNQYTLFIQDDTNEHIINNEQFIKEIDYVIENNIQFKLMGTSWRKGMEVCIRQIVNGMNDLWTFPSVDCIQKTCKRLDISLPNVYYTETCAFFICNKDIILARPKEFYIKLREWLLEDERNGFALEHMWKIIFV